VSAEQALGAVACLALGVGCVGEGEIATVAQLWAGCSPRA